MIEVVRLVKVGAVADWVVVEVNVKVIAVVDFSGCELKHQLANWVWVKCDVVAAVGAVRRKADWDYWVDLFDYELD